MLYRMGSTVHVGADYGPQQNLSFLISAGCCLQQQDVQDTPYTVLNNRNSMPHASHTMQEMEAGRAACSMFALHER